MASCNLRPRRLATAAVATLLPILAVLHAGAGDRAAGDGASQPSVATFAGGCFWCLEADLEKVEGVFSAVSGYTGGHAKDPTYEKVSAGGTGHAEAVRVEFDPQRVSYEELLEHFWRNIDPTVKDRQFCDVGSQYRSAIFYHDEAQRAAAQHSRNALAADPLFKGPIYTEITASTTFYPAEEYHQDYAKHHPIRYRYYRRGCGRDRRLEEIWERKRAIEMGDEELRERLTPEQYQVTREDGTERPFQNAYWDNHRDGIYVDIVSGEALFSSVNKFNSGTGWPSFTQPLKAENIVERKDRSWFTVRTEVRSAIADSHLGHVFDDGPAPTGLRYCVNSAALRFIPVEDLEDEGYGEYRVLFDEKPTAKE